MILKDHLRSDKGYTLKVDPEQEGAEALIFEFPAEPPPGVSVADYEKSQRREVALLVAARVEKAKAPAQTRVIAKDTKLEP